MEYGKRDFLINRICAGYVNIKIVNSKFKVIAPPFPLLYEGGEVYNEVRAEAESFGCFTDEEIYYNLIAKGCWSEDEEKEELGLPDIISDLKHRLFLAADKPKEQHDVREEIKSKLERLATLEAKKGVWDAFSCKGLATYAKWGYILEQCVIDMDDKKVDFGDWNIDLFLHKYQQESLDQDTLRYLAHHEPWTTTWAIKKANRSIFPEPFSNEQKSLLSWSILYDNIHKSIDCPHQSIIEDDWMLDGWLVDQKKKINKDKTEKQIYDKFAHNPRLRKCEEIFIVAKDIKEAQKIHDLNSPVSKSIIKERLGRVKSQGEVNYKAFRDVKLRNMEKVANAFRNRVKGK